MSEVVEVRVALWILETSEHTFFVAVVNGEPTKMWKIRKVLER